MGLSLVEDDDLKDFYRILKASASDQAADKEKDPEKRDKLETRARRLRGKLKREDTLSDLFELFDAVIAEECHHTTLVGNLRAFSPLLWTLASLVPSLIPIPGVLVALMLASVKTTDRTETHLARQVVPA